jgi:predicted ATPase
VQLPSQLTTLVGRESDIAEVAGMFAEGRARLVTLIGTGGIGKTRLALAVAEAMSDVYPDGTFFVDLADEHDPEQVLPKIAEAAAIPVAGPVLETLSEAFAHQRALLVLDNLEQIIPAGAAIARLLARCPGLHALVTSRVALRVRGEHEYQVEPLALPTDDASAIAAITPSAAVRLFEERARAVRPQFRVSGDDAGHVAAIVRRLDGLPLAIELAAARMRLLSAKTLAHQLSRSLDALGQGPTDAPTRQQTLSSTIEWSHELLT